MVGCRADEIIERELYDDPFDMGSLFYIQDTEVHESIEQQDINLQLIQFTFQKFLLNAAGMIFVIPQTVHKEEQNSSKKTPIKIIKYLELIRQYEKCGFVRAFNSDLNDTIMEIEVLKLQDF